MTDAEKINELAAQVCALETMVTALMAAAAGAIPDGHGIIRRALHMSLQHAEGVAKDIRAEGALEIFPGRVRDIIKTHFVRFDNATTGRVVDMPPAGRA